MFSLGVVVTTWSPEPCVPARPGYDGKRRRPTGGMPYYGSEEATTACHRRIVEHGEVGHLLLQRSNFVDLRSSPKYVEDSLGSCVVVDR